MPRTVFALGLFCCLSGGYGFPGSFHFSTSQETSDKFPETLFRYTLTPPPWTSTVWFPLWREVEVAGKAFASIKVPFSLAEFAARYTPWYYQRTKSKPRFTPYSLEVLQSNSNISHAKASRELGYRPRPLLETIADTVRWFFENRKVKSAA